MNQMNQMNQIIVEASPIEEESKYKILVDLMESGKIYLSVRSLETGIKYERNLLKGDNFWNTHKNVFQNKFSIFFQLLEKIFMDKGEDYISWNVENETDELIDLRLIQEGIMGFDITIQIEKKEDDLSMLQTKNKKLEEKVMELERIVNLIINQTIPHNPTNRNDWILDHYENNKQMILDKMKKDQPSGEKNSTHHESNYYQTLTGLEEYKEKENKFPPHECIGYPGELNGSEFVQYFKEKHDIKL
jgi:hypothetical protein